MMTKHNLEKQLLNYQHNNYNLPANMKPILQISHIAKLLIIGPAPGIKAYDTGIPWNDPSGEKLRLWLGVSRDEFYNSSKIALLSMNFWYPGVNKYGNDKPPSIMQAELLHRPLLKLLPHIKLTILVGYQAQLYYLKEKSKKSLTETVKCWREYLPQIIVLPHPSWHNNNWIKKHTWFETELLLELRERVKEILNA